MKISRNNYFAIAMMMLILTFMFQFTVVAKQELNEYGINEYDQSASTKHDKKTMYQVTHKVTEDREYVLFIGDEKRSSVTNVVTWWCTYSKRELIVTSSLSGYKMNQKNLPDVIVVDSGYFDGRKDLNVLKKMAQYGVDIIFANLPSVETIEKDESLRDFLGIRQIMSDQVQLTGVVLFEDFLLGDKAIYEAENEDDEERQDMNLNIPWYVTGEGTKTYMSGHMDLVQLQKAIQKDDAMMWTGMLKEDGEGRNESLPAIIWRKTVGDGYVFCVNGDYMSDISGIGILQAMMAETEEYVLYPVVNAQNLVVANYPGIANENVEEFRERYSQSQIAVFRDVIWPSLAAMAEEADSRLTCMVTPQYEYEDDREPEAEHAVYFFNMLKEEHGEAGLTTVNRSDLACGDKFRIDDEFWKESMPEYSFLSAYAKNQLQITRLARSNYIPSLRTITAYEEKKDDPVISYAQDGVTLQRATSNGIRHTYMDDFRVRCFETALGYSNIILDFECLAYPESDDDSWENYSPDMAANVCTYWKSYAAFQSTTLSESDQKIRRFLALDYKETREDNTIIVEIENFDESASFLFRCDDAEVKEVTNGTFQSVEDGVWLIEASDSRMEIQLEEEHRVFIAD